MLQRHSQESTSNGWNGKHFARVLCAFCCTFFSHSIWDFFLLFFVLSLAELSGNVRQKSTHYRNEFDANPATCSFLRAFRYIADQIKSSHQILMSVKHHHPESVHCAFNLVGFSERKFGFFNRCLTIDFGVSSAKQFNWQQMLHIGDCFLVFGLLSREKILFFSLLRHKSLQLMFNMFAI